MSDRSQSGRALTSVVGLLAILVAVGGWNYHRNWNAEKQTQAARPYSSYATVDLEALREAYQAELASVRVQFDRAKSQRARSQGDVGSISGNVKNFQKATQASSAIRAAAGGVADREGQIAELDRELQLRAQFGEGMERHIKRLTTF